MKRQTTLIVAAIAGALSVAIPTAQSQVVTERVTTEPVEVIGTVTESAPDAIVLRTETSTAPMRYSFTKQTEYVDELGNPVSIEVVKSGAPVTVRYIRQGDALIAKRVIVRRATTTVPESITTKKTTTTTTTTKDDD